MVNRSIKIGAALVAAVVGLAASQVKADVLLSTLVSGNGTLTAGNVTFSDFSYFDNTPPGTQIEVSTSTSGSQAFITFTAIGGWSAANNHSAINFDVASTSAISAVTGSFVATAGKATGEFATVGETVTNLSLPSTDSHYDQVISPALFVDGANGLPDTTSTSLTLFQPSTTLHIVKSIDLGADATITSVTNGYVTAPEPASLGMLSAAGLGLLIRRRRAAR